MKKLLTQDFIRRSMDIHGNKYDYSKVKYINNDEKVELICDLHGSFLITPKNHLLKQGCKQCGYLNRNNRNKSLENFKKDAGIKHNNKYDYSLTEYKTARDLIKIICKIHGEFIIQANRHLNGCGCQHCGIEKNAQKRTLTQDDFIKKANKIHSFKYDYKKSVYLKNNIKLVITCLEHGDFEQAAHAHLSGQGCKKCALEYNTFKKSDWIKKAKGKEGIFYILKCYNKEEIFYKLGITYNSLKRRYSCKLDMPYNYEIIKEIKSNDLDYIWRLEKRFKKFKSKNHYTPKIYFGGSKTECFK